MKKCYSRSLDKIFIQYKIILLILPFMTGKYKSNIDLLYFLNDTVLTK